MTVREWMTRDPLTVGPQTELREALARMVRHRVRHLPVLEEGRLLGMLYGPRLLTQTLAGPDLARHGQRKVHEFCQEVPPIEPDLSVMEAFQRLAQVTCLPVVEHGRLAGVFSHGNMLQYLLGEVAPARAHRRANLASANRLDALQSLARELSEARDTPEILKVVVRHARTVMPVEQAFIWLREPGQTNLTLAASELDGPHEEVGNDLPIHDTLSGWVATHRKSLRVDDLKKERRFPHSRRKLDDSAELVELRSVIATPLMDRQTCIGVFHFWSRRPHAYVDADLELLELIGGNVAFMVERAWTVAREHKLVEELQRATQIKDEFLAVVTHDLRNALQGVLSYAGLLVRKAPDEKTARIARGLVDTGNYMRALTNDLHDLARLGMQAIKLDPAQVEVESLVTRALEDLTDFAHSEGVELRPAQLEPGLTLRADRVRLRQVVDNLVSNAIKYNRPGGWVQVRARSDGEWILLEVEDNGIGIMPEEQEMVFGLFARASNHKRSDSSGLGLSITRQLVAMHGGNLTLRSVPQQGSLFSVRLPGKGA